MDFSLITTLRTGGPAPALKIAKYESQMTEAVMEADTKGQPVLVIGAGSHLVVSDSGFQGLLINDGRSHIYEVDSFVSCGGSTVRATAGVSLDEFVQFTLKKDLAGLEALSGIPGTLGGAVVTNAGAFGQEIAQTIASVRALDRTTGYVHTLSRFDLHFGYRSSILSRSSSSKRTEGDNKWGPTGRWVVLDATFQLRSASLSEPIRYRSLAESLGVELGTRVQAQLVREHVLKIRRNCGMLLHPRDHDTWSVGQYFRNPILDEDELGSLPPQTLRYPVRNQAMFVSGSVNKQAPLIPGKAKIPANWLISQAGFAPGYRLHPDARAALSTKSVGVVTNRGGANTAEILELGRAVRVGVQERFGVTLVEQGAPVGFCWER